MHRRHSLILGKSQAPLARPIYQFRLRMRNASERFDFLWTSLDGWAKKIGPTAMQTIISAG